MRVVANNISVNNFTLELGNGGRGGDAETIKNCEHGIAKGGERGEAGNFKISAEDSIQIASFRIIPGRGGLGGSGTAFGKDGEAACPGRSGGDATATGGNGGGNNKELAVTGSVTGVDTVAVDTVYGGWGGTATAHPGGGGDGDACGCAGGDGGNGKATGGAGGDASIKLATGAGGTDTVGGRGGDADAKGGAGGSGGVCNSDGSVENAGKKGNALSKGGSGGHGNTRNGEEGTEKHKANGK